MADSDGLSSLAMEYPHHLYTIFVLNVAMNGLARGCLKGETRGPGGGITYCIRCGSLENQRVCVIRSQAPRKQASV
jgi:hypothetical protein